MRRFATPVVTALLSAALVALLAYGVIAKSPTRSLDEQLASGHRPVAPVAALPLLDGRGDSSLAAFRGKVVVLNFWASWCPPCQQEAPMLEATERKLTGHAATVLGVTYEDTSNDSDGFIAKHRLTFPQLRDVTGSFAHSYGTDQLPESFVIDRDGHVAKIWRGEVTPTFLAFAVKLARST